LPAYEGIKRYAVVRLRSALNGASVGKVMGNAAGSRCSPA
jgi:hypothetical protein